MKKEEKKAYEAPTLTTVTVKAERGYAASQALGLSSDYGNDQVEDRNDAGNWGGSDGWF